MTTPLLSILGILLASASGSMLFYHGGDALETGVSRAQTAATVMMVTQVAQAVQLHDIQEGTPYEGPDLGGLVETRYLRTLPTNPSGGQGPRIETRAGRRVVSMRLSGAGPAGCDRVSTLLKRAPSGMTGCDGGSGDPVVYATI